MSNNDPNLYTAFFGRKNGNGNKYNFDLEPLIQNFDFYDFFYNGMKFDVDDYGAFVVMTTKQYVMGYNSGFGFGSHHASYARVLKDISGGGVIANDRDLATLSFKCLATYITIRICCEKIEGKHVSCMSVNIPKNGITREQFEIFEQFYNDYNYEIEKLCNKFNCHVTFTKRDGTAKMYISNNLNEVRDYLKSIIDEEKVIDEKFEEMIIGVTQRHSRKK